MSKKRIKSNEKIPIKLSISQRDLILEYTFIEAEYIDLLESATLQSGHLTLEITLEDIDTILGHIAASENHAEDKELETRLDNLYDYLSDIESSYVIVDKE
jgi:hypothetical protein